MNSVSVNVRGVRRNVFLGRQIAPNKWRARVVVDSDNVPSGRTSVRGVYQVYANGAKRFVPTNSSAKSLLR